MAAGDLKRSTPGAVFTGIPGVLSSPQVFATPSLPEQREAIHGIAAAPRSMPAPVNGPGTASRHPALGRPPADENVKVKPTRHNP